MGEGGEVRVLHTSKLPQEHKKWVCNENIDSPPEFHALDFLSAAVVNIDRGTAVIFSTALHVSKSPTIPINKSFHTCRQHEGFV